MRTHPAFLFDCTHPPTSVQALADYAVMLTALKAEWNATASPVVAVGGSYGGMLAAWARIQYPNVFAAALAASAPIKIASGIPADPGFFEVCACARARARVCVCGENGEKGGRGRHLRQWDSIPCVLWKRD